MQQFNIDKIILNKLYTVYKTELTHLPICAYLLWTYDIS